MPKVNGTYRITGHSQWDIISAYNRLRNPNTSNKQYGEDADKFHNLVKEVYRRFGHVAETISVYHSPEELSTYAICSRRLGHRDVYERIKLVIAQTRYGTNQ